ncbi:oligosaccharide flippase family protein [Salimicrobium sp. PL1-032A]|uniref:lipopolysaccharide biosynthesis protein n=1 Tax=Salimicrobium sp. PL1-032A TaxID=3095364 RepID=UPI003260B328
MSKKKSFKAHFLTLAKGNVGSQILLILGLPLLVSLYSPSDFGIFAIYSTVLAMGLVVSTFTFDKTIPIEKEERAYEQLVYLSLLSVLISTGSSALILTILHIILSVEYYGILLLALLGSCLAGSFQVMVQFHVRNKNFFIIAKCKVIQNSLILTGQLCFFVFFEGFGLLIGDVLGRLVSLLIITRHLPLLPFDRAVMVTMVQKYKNFALHSSPAVLINSGAIQIPLLLATYLYGEAGGGNYLLSYKIIGVPVTLIALTYSQVYYGMVSRELAQGNTMYVIDLFDGTIKRFFYWSVVLIIGVIGIGPLIAEVIFGDEWSDVTVIIKQLAPLFFMQLIALPVSQTLYLLQEQKTQLAWESVRLIGIIVIWWGGSWIELSMHQTLSIYAWFSVICYTGFLILCRKHLGEEHKRQKKGTTWVDAAY